ncbi:EAL domain-containing protein [Thiorhodococcus mannitoliphagus]|uniref:cyclic-guanylate-specific phosphodiesterase n=1 Tax=Thiorhodococcus mannitoliphagus TaxID=329406 RepID=A0A6P1E4N3_9GAMM|nr:EAL domain-containing protein [Thiorhodococcus mannitoliphagus]NEX22605.1 EAL domain-containing protein [Thiorhodococcus mannitoliphagus]
MQMLVAMLLAGLLSVSTAAPSGVPESATPGSTTWVHTPSGRRVLLLLSYDPTFPTSQKIVQAVGETLFAAGVGLKVEYLDSKIQWDETFVQQYAALLSHKLIREAPFDLVITADDNALQLMLDHRVRGLDGLPVVYMGINDQARMRQAEAEPRTTGIYESPSLAETVELAARLFPAATELVVIVDGTVSGQGDLAALRALDGEHHSFGLRVLSLKELTWDELGEQLAALDDTSVLLLLSAYEDRDGQGKSFAESLALIRSRSTRPIFHLWEHGLGAGILGGVLVSHSAQARQAAAMAVEILAGADPSALPAIWEGANLPIFDDRELRRFGIPESALPEGSRLLYRPDTLMSRHGRLVIGAGVVFLLLTGTILTLLLLIYSRKRALRSLAESQQRFEQASRFAGFGVWELAAATQRVFSDSSLRDLLRYGPDDGLRTLEDWLRILPEPDRSMARATFADILEGRVDRVQLKHRARRKDDTEAQLEVEAIALHKDGQRCLIGLTRDVTDRAMAEAALRASEALYRETLESISDPVFITTLTGDFTFVCLHEHRLFGRSEADVWAMKRLSALLGAEAFAPEELAAGQEIRNREVSVEGVDGRQHRLLVSIKPVHIGDGRVLVTCRDVTELMQARQAIADEREHLQRIIDGITEPLMVIDANRNIIKMNEAARRGGAQAPDTGPPTCYGVAKHRAEPCHGEDEPCPLMQVLASGVTSKVVHNELIAGQPRTLEIVASPLRDTEGRINSIIEVTHDITDYLGVVARLREQELTVERLETHDHLTGLPNRLLFNDRLTQAIDRAHRHGWQLAVLFVDLDRFQRVNDSFGHPIGDEVLKIAAQRIGALVPEGDTLARIGGDAFIMLLRSLSGAQDTIGAARAILNDFAQPFLLEERTIYLSASVGISVYPHNGTTADLLVSNADAAMHKAKDKGGNTFAYYTEDMTQFARERLMLEASLRNAIANDELEVYYQPQLDLRDGRLVGAEALVRWRHPSRGIVSPDGFIGVAEETGIILELGRRVLELACRQMRAWLDSALMPTNATIAVNLSARQFDDLSLGDEILRILTDVGLDPRRLELEITESLLVTHRVNAEPLLHRLRAEGIGVAIDDFGTGYSSLSYLKRLPITKLKIDRAFVADIPSDRDAVAITGAVISLAQSLGLEVLAEGIETLEQQTFLSSGGCRLGQGYLFARPMPARSFEDFAAQRTIRPLWSRIQVDPGTPSPRKRLSVCWWTGREREVRLPKMDDRHARILTRMLLALGLTIGAHAPALAADGATLYKEKLCHSCHGDHPNEPVLPIYPKLSGQNSEYLLQQMKDIRDGQRTNGLSAAMRAVVGGLTDEEIQTLAAWLSTR